MSSHLSGRLFFHLLAGGGPEVTKASYDCAMATFNKTTDPSECNYSLLFCVVIVIVTYKLWVVVFQTLCRRENHKTLTGGRIKAEIVALAQVDQMKRKWMAMTQLFFIPGG